MYRFDVQGGCDDGYVPVVFGPELLAHDEEGTSVGIGVHEEEVGEVVADGRLATGGETEHEDQF